MFSPLEQRQAIKIKIKRPARVLYRDERQQALPEPHGPTLIGGDVGIGRAKAVSKARGGALAGKAAMLIG